MKTYSLHFLLVLCVSSLTAQVGINTNSPKGILDIESTNSAMVLPRIVDPETDIGSNSKKGMLVYDKTVKNLKFYDGSEWKFVSHTAQPALAKNTGVVKIVGYYDNTNTLVQPSYSTPSGGTTVRIVYGDSLAFASSPTTSWPKNIVQPNASHIYNTNKDTFVENDIEGQVNIWRIEFSFNQRTNDTSGVNVIFKLTNQLSGFVGSQNTFIPTGNRIGTASASIITIADGASLPAPNGTGEGYELTVTPDDPIDFTIKSITRISVKNIK